MKLLKILLTCTPLVIIFFALVISSEPAYAALCTNPNAGDSRNTCNPGDACAGGLSCTQASGYCFCPTVNQPPTGLCTNPNTGDSRNTCTSGSTCPGGLPCTQGSGYCFCPTVNPAPGGGSGGSGTSCGIFGCITNPLPVDPTNKAPGGGLISLLNNILRLIFVAAGIYAFVRIVLAGLKFMSAGGDSKAIEAAWNSIWQSILGVVIIISSLALAALIGQVLYGDPTAILNPKIYGPVVP